MDQTGEFEWQTSKKKFDEVESFFIKNIYRFTNDNNFRISQATHGRGKGSSKVSRDIFWFWTLIFRLELFIKEKRREKACILEKKMSRHTGGERVHTSVIKWQKGKGVYTSVSKWHIGRGVYTSIPNSLNTWGGGLKWAKKVSLIIWMVP